MRRAALLSCFVFVSLAACGDSTPINSGHDAGTTPDAGPTNDDAGTADAGAPDDDAGTDAGTLPTDAGCTFEDPLDDLGLDQNCDGAEGVIADAIYVANDGDDIYGGNPQYPVKTLARALALYRLDRARRSVLVATSATAYSAEGLGALLTEGAVVTGGLSRAVGWSRPQGVVTAPALTTLEAPGSGVVADVQNAGTSLSFVALRSVADGGLDTFGLVLSGGVSLQLRHASIEVGAAGDGLAGVDGVDAGDNVVAFEGGDANPQNVLDPTGPAGTGACGAVLALSGGKGGMASMTNPSDGSPGEADVDGGQAPAAGGAKGSSFAAGATGEDGHPGLEGEAGVAAAETWSFADGGVVTGEPTVATVGRLGGGGGGGGGGQSNAALPGGGGGGGAGGCPGGAGAPGTRGGFSLGLVATGQWPTLEDVRVVSGAAGRGGTGGAGGLGGAGGQGGQGTPGATNPSKSGNGGAGGRGGPGGRGAAGNGGWSVGVVAVGSTVPDPLAGVTVTPGTAGLAGDADAHDGQSLPAANR